MKHWPLTLIVIFLHLLSYVRFISYELFIAIKYFFARKQTGFISFHSLVSLLGVTLGVSALLLVLFVMSGLESEISRRILESSTFYFL